MGQAERVIVPDTSPMFPSTVTHLAGAARQRSIAVRARRSALVAMCAQSECGRLTYWSRPSVGEQTATTAGHIFGFVALCSSQRRHPVAHRAEAAKVAEAAEAQCWPMQATAASARGREHRSEDSVALPAPRALPCGIGPAQGGRRGRVVHTARFVGSVPKQRVSDSGSGRRQSAAAAATHSARQRGSLVTASYILCIRSDPQAMSTVSLHVHIPALFEHSPHTLYTCADTSLVILEGQRLASALISPPHAAPLRPRLRRCHCGLITYTSTAMTVRLLPVSKPTLTNGTTAINGGPTVPDAHTPHDAREQPSSSPPEVTPATLPPPSSSVRPLHIRSPWLTVRPICRPLRPRALLVHADGVQYDGPLQEARQARYTLLPAADLHPTVRLSPPIRLTTPIACVSVRARHQCTSRTRWRCRRTCWIRGRRPSSTPSFCPSHWARRTSPTPACALHERIHRCSLLAAPHHSSALTLSSRPISLSSFPSSSHPLVPSARRVARHTFTGRSHSMVDASELQCACAERLCGMLEGALV